MADWSEWVQDVAGGVVRKATDAKYVQPYETRKLELEALGTDGYYTEGKANAAGGIGGISPTMLLIGGALLVGVLMLKD